MTTFSQLGQQGRLGNQLWQMATTMCLAINHNDHYVFPIWPYEPFFNLHGCFVNNPGFSATYTEPFFHYAPIPWQPGLNLSGYFQSYKYMVGMERFIIDRFTPIHQVEEKPNATSIHIRRGDYVNLKEFHTNLDMNYFNKAMSLCNTEKYYVFSDDIGWCRQQFVGPQFEFVEGNHETMDLAIMAKCANNIIANSSFSFWGAYLNQNPNKKVIAPLNWFGPKLPHDTKDLLPPDWIRI